MTEEKDLNGLSGWLILVGLGVVISPVRIILQLFPLYTSIFSNGSWQILTTPGSEAYHVLWAPIIIGEILINLLLILTWIFLAFLFFTKKRIFPVCYISALAFSLFFIVADAAICQIVLPSEAIFDPVTAKETGKTFLACVIWIPYMLVSRRVKATFTQEWNKQN